MFEYETPTFNLLVIVDDALFERIKFVLLFNF